MVVCYRPASAGRHGNAVDLATVGRQRDRRSICLGGVQRPKPGGIPRSADQPLGIGAELHLVQIPSAGIELAGGLLQRFGLQIPQGDFLGSGIARQSRQPFSVA